MIIFDCGNDTNSNSAGTSAPATTIQINQTVTYSGVDITILNVQQADGFSDDTSAGTNDVVRLSVKAGKPDVRMYQPKTVNPNVQT